MSFEQKSNLCFIQIYATYRLSSSGLICRFDAFVATLNLFSRMLYLTSVMLETSENVTTSLCMCFFVFYFQLPAYIL